MKKIIKLNETILEKIIETSIKTYLNEGIKNYINEGVDFGKFGNSKEMSLKFVKQKLAQPIRDGIIDPRALEVDNFGHVIYTRNLPKGVKINPRTFEVTRVNNGIGGGRRNRNEIPLAEYQEQHPEDEFVPLIFVGNKNNMKITDEVRKLIAQRYSISRLGMVLDRDRDVIIEPYLKGTGKNIDFRARDVNGQEIYHGNTTIDSLIKASFGY